MHVILKSNIHKGILVITHKEFPFFERNNNLNYLCEKYYVILHIGANIQIPRYDSRISFIALPESRCSQKEHIPFTSRSFTPSCFYCEPTNKRNIDFLCVSRAIHIKHTKEVLSLFTGLHYNLTYIILKQNPKDKYYREVISNKYPDNIRIIDTHNIEDREYKGLTHEQLSKYYKNSKVFIQSSLSEGESRTIHEAYCSGCVIMSIDNMIGGGNDFYNKKNYVLYNFKTFRQKVTDALSLASNYSKIPNDIKFLDEKYSIPRFKKFLNKNFPKLATGKWDLDKLSLKLPAHFFKLPWYLKNDMTSDILTDFQFDIFAREYLIK